MRDYVFFSIMVFGFAPLGLHCGSMRCVVCGVGGWDPFVWGCVFRCAFATTSDIPDESSISLFLVMYHSVTFGCQLLFLAVKLSDAFFDVCCAIISI